MNVTINGKEAGPNARVLVMVDDARVRADYGRAAAQWVSRAEAFVQEVTGMRPFTWYDSAGGIVIGDSSLRDTTPKPADLMGQVQGAIKTVGPDQTLVIRLNSNVTPEAAKQFADLARKQASEAGIGVLVVVADEMAVATPGEGIRVRTSGTLEATSRTLRQEPDLGDDPDGDNTPGMGDH